MHSLRMRHSIPQEIQDMIFLQFGPYGSDYETLKNTRVLQSEYVRNVTRFDKYEDVISNSKDFRNMNCES